ncbi:dehydrogenase domain protein [Mycobacterium xenopi 3993]|nr:dehydrogenase domain protein [Mycobacterium xenopi 3993]
MLTKGIVDVLEHGAGHLVQTPELYAWVLAAVVAMVFQQSAFRAGALTASLPTITVAKPVVATVLGSPCSARVCVPTAPSGLCSSSPPWW